MAPEALDSPDPPPPGGEGEQSRRPSWFRALQVGAVAVVAGLLALLGWRIATSSEGAALVSAIRNSKKPPAPGFTLGVIWPHAETWPSPACAALADGKVSLAELRRHPVVLNFWASWCEPCKTEAPRFAASARDHHGVVAFLGLDVQDFTSDAHGFLRASGSTTSRCAMAATPLTPATA